MIQKKQRGRINPFETIASSEAYTRKNFSHGCLANVASLNDNKKVEEYHSVMVYLYSIRQV